MTQRTYRLAVLPGDGIGREVVTEGLKVLAAVAPIAGVRYELAEYPFGADHYLATRELLAPSAVEEMRRTDAVYFGAIGDARVPPGVLEHGVLLGLVRALDLYVNVRPIRLYAAGLSPLAGKRPEDVDFVIVRETTEDCFSPDVRVLHRDSEDEVAIGQMVYTRRGTERAMRFAFDLARRPGRRGRVTNVHQANAIGAHGLLHRTFEAVAAQSPGVAAEEMAPDTAAMRLVTNPEALDVVITTNFIGGILTDLGAALIGGLGIAPSARLHPGRTSLFEPTHGSAPKYAGTGKASPLAAILAMAMLLDALGEADAARRIEAAVAETLRSGAVPSATARSGLTTRQVGDVVADRVVAGEGSAVAR
jgi:3-isopropylmalate dehydrogenase